MLDSFGNVDPSYGEFTWVYATTFGSKAHEATGLEKRQTPGRDSGNPA